MNLYCLHECDCKNARARPCIVFIMISCEIHMNLNTRSYELNLLPLCKKIAWHTVATPHIQFEMMTYDNTRKHIPIVWTRKIAIISIKCARCGCVSSFNGFTPLSLFININVSFFSFILFVHLLSIHIFCRPPRSSPTLCLHCKVLQFWRVK